MEEKGGGEGYSKQEGSPTELIDKLKTIADQYRIDTKTKSCCLGSLALLVEDSIKFALTC
ncbi:MAG: hypothetical protein WCF03_05225 [Nitrososphaeraceae archaeon]